MRLWRGFFVGGEGTYFYSRIDSNANKDLDGKNGDAFDFGLKLGYLFTDEHKVYGIYRYNFKANYDEYFELSVGNITTSFNHILRRKTNQFLLAYDFTPQLSDSWLGVLGVFGGYANAKLNVNTKSIYYKKGLAYGAKIGILYEFNANSEIELGLRAEQTRFYKKDNKPVFSDFGLYAGYNYKF